MLNYQIFTSLLALKFDMANDIFIKVPCNGQKIVALGTWPDDKIANL